MAIYTPPPPQTLKQHEQVEKERERVKELHQKALQEAEKQKPKSDNDAKAQVSIDDPIFTSTLQPSDNGSSYADSVTSSAYDWAPTIMFTIFVVGLLVIIKRQLP